ATRYSCRAHGLVKQPIRQGPAALENADASCGANVPAKSPRASISRREISRSGLIDAALLIRSRQHRHRSLPSQTRKILTETRRDSRSRQAKSRHRLPRTRLPLVHRNNRSQNQRAHDRIPSAPLLSGCSESPLSRGLDLHRVAAPLFLTVRRYFLREGRRCSIEPKSAELQGTVLTGDSEQVAHSSANWWPRRIIARMFSTGTSRGIISPLSRMNPVY
ncbi:MAG: hypothetical protein H6Q05_4374, partial [Acidobacteria bacterium]|nr:hypothetical protein [Acidobacteriota bacterium]